jgi:hypothetical protein
MNGPVQLAAMNPFVAVGACVLLPGAAVTSMLLLGAALLKKRGRGVNCHAWLAVGSVAAWLSCIAVFRLLGPSAGGVIRAAVISSLAMAGAGACVEGFHYPDEPKLPLALLAVLNILVMLLTMVTVFQLARR